MISSKKIEQLIGQTKNLNLTITLPTHKKGEEVQQDPIRFKNLLSKAAEKLSDKGMKKNEINEFLMEPRDLLDNVSFWNHAEEGLAVYVNEDTCQFFTLPYALNEQIYLNSHFLVTPLLPMISLEGSYHVLAVSQKNVRLLRCTRQNVMDVTPSDIFRSIDEFLDEKPQAHLQFHSGNNNQEAMYFGHGGNEEDKKVYVEKYLRGVEESVTRQLKKTGEPLIIAGTEEILPIYRSQNKYNRLLESSIPGSAGEMKEKQLQEAGWHIIRGYFLKDMYAAIEQFTGEKSDRISNNLSEIVESTVMGKTDTLLIAKDESSWGLYDEKEHVVNYSNGQEREDNELLNWTALKAMEQGGKVFVLPKEEMPYASTIAALFRF